MLAHSPPFNHRVAFSGKGEAHVLRPHLATINHGESREFDPRPYCGQIAWGQSNIMVPRPQKRNEGRVVHVDLGGAFLVAPRFGEGLDSSITSSYLGILLRDVR